MSENCEDYDDGFKKSEPKGYTYKCGKVVWASEEEMKKNLECYDQAHSKAKCLTERQVNRIIDELEEHANSGIKPLCKDLKSVVYECVKNEKSISACFREIDDFKECLEETVRETFTTICEERKQK